MCAPPMPGRKPPPPPTAAVAARALEALDAIAALVAVALAAATLSQAAARALVSDIAPAMPGATAAPKPVRFSRTPVITLLSSRIDSKIFRRPGDISSTSLNNAPTSKPVIMLFLRQYIFQIPSQKPPSRNVAAADP